GVAGNGSGFTAGNPSAPQGTQVGFLQGAGSTISQAINFAVGTYTIGFQAAQRGNYQASSQTVAGLLDRSVIGTFTPSNPSYASYSPAAFSVTAGAHTITFKGLNPNGSDNTAFVDQVQLSAVTVTASATFIQNDATTQGSWQAAYGADGYD